MIVSINNLPLQFDWGTFMMAAEITGKDAVNPLEGVPLSECFTVILAAAGNRYKEANNQPADITVEWANNRIKSFTLPDIRKLENTWIKVATISDVDVDKESEEPAVKKNRRPSAKSTDSQ